jgi:MtaA/CmuA family methyltransferase
MNGKELLFKTLRKEETTRPAWVPFVGIHGGQIIDVTAEEYLKSSDLIVQGLTKAIALYKPDGIPIVFDLQVEAEILSCELRWSAESPPSVVSHPLQSGTLADLPPFDATKGRFPLILDALRQLKKDHGDQVAMYGLITGPFTLALHLMGNDLFLNMFDKEDMVKEVLSFCAEVGKKSARAYIENGADVIAVVDPMTSQISSTHFETFVTPFINEVYDYIREQKAFSSLFVCGDATRNLEVMAQTHCDNISIDENISLELLTKLGKQYDKSVGGNLQLTVSLLLGTEDESKLDAIRCIKAAEDSPGFVLSPGCDIPWGVPVKNLQAVADMLLDSYQRDVAEHTIKIGEVDSFEDITLPDYNHEENVYVDIITLDSTSCAPCQYMLEAAHQAVDALGENVIVTEHKIKTRQGLGVMTKLGIRNIPTICIDGHARFVSMLPDQNILIDTIRTRVNQKKAMMS